MHAHPATLPPGSSFADGRFRIEALVGTGGTGAVYRALDCTTGERRALKVMHEELMEEPRSARRFLREARVGASVRSTHIARVLSAGIDAEHGLPWLAMELLEGSDLASVLEAHGPLGVRETVFLCAELCDALGAAHDAGIVHRDVKPDNVFLSHERGAREVVKLLDFGIATTATGAASTVTDAIGTPAFMAPEQFVGGRVTPAADVWALGLLVFRALTGHYFWKSADGAAPPARLVSEVLSAHIPFGSERAAELGAPLGAFPPELDTWLAGCLWRDPALRYRGAREAFAALVRAAWPAMMRERREARAPAARAPRAPRVHRSMAHAARRGVALCTAIAVIATSLVCGIGTAFAVAGAM
jgi:serine/threonine-protein kinase